MKTFLLFALLVPVYLFSQTTSSWIGLNSSWSDENNWTNGVPNDTIDAVLGDSCYTAFSQPIISSTSRCKSLLLDSIKQISLSIDASFYVQGDISLLALNDSILHTSSKLTLRGDWSNEGIYLASGTAQVAFGGSGQLLSGNTPQIFNSLHINGGSELSLNTSIQILELFSLSGSCNPQSFLVDADSIQVNNNACLYVRASTFEENYSAHPTVTAGGIIEYASDNDQTVSSHITYSTLKLSGDGKKSLISDLPKLLATSSSAGRIYVNEGEFDLGVYHADRDTLVEGGYFTVADGAVLRIDSELDVYIPQNYKNSYFHANSTVEYYGVRTNLKESSHKVEDEMCIQQKGRLLLIKGITQPGTIFIHDVHGREIQNFTASKTTNSYEMPINVVFVVSLIVDKKVFSKKLLFR